MKRRTAAGCAAFVLLWPSIARADWTVAAFLGASATRANTLTLEQPADRTRIRITPVRYDGRPFETPLYYGVRAGRLLRNHTTIEGEFIHLKVYARTADAVSVSGRVRGVDTNVTAPLSGSVQQFSMSHGLNLVLMNVSWPIIRTAAVTVSVRGGAGVSLPHAESTIDAVSREQYEIGSTAVQVGAGVDFRLAGRVRALVEYKLTTTHPELAVAGGTVAGRFVSHHVVFGVALHAR